MTGTQQTFRLQQSITQRQTRNFFEGYEGRIEFYTFKTNFNKMFSEKTPSHLLPDLLKKQLLVRSSTQHGQVD